MRLPWSKAWDIQTRFIVSKDMRTLETQMWVREPGKQWRRSLDMEELARALVSEMVRNVMRRMGLSMQEAAEQAGKVR